MFDVRSLIEAGGLLLIAAVIFAESGMFVGFFFPGDTLLLTAGVLTAQHAFSAPIEITILIIALAAIAGDNVGYWIGRRFGPLLFSKKDSLIFRKQYIERAHAFYTKYGNRTMLIAHFVPVVRTFASPVAGAAGMDYKKFVIYDAIGDTAWAALVTLIGYWFGNRIPNIDHYIILGVVAVMAITLGPALYHLAKAILEKRNRPTLTPEKKKK